MEKVFTNQPDFARVGATGSILAFLDKDDPRATYSAEQLFNALKEWWEGMILRHGDQPR